ncbi:MAG: cupin domain-containing protein [Thermomicrobiales bacterium]
MAGIKVTRIDRSHGSVSADPIFAGRVEIQELVNDAAAELLRVTAVTFVDGAENRPHAHSTDQVLVATSGQGFVATSEERQALAPGDVALIPARTRHWHGAASGATFTHLSILTPGHMWLEPNETDEDG